MFQYLKYLPKKTRPGLLAQMLQTPALIALAMVLEALVEIVKYVSGSQAVVVLQGALLAVAGMVVLGGLGILGWYLVQVPYWAGGALLCLPTGLVFLLVLVLPGLGRWNQ